VPNLTGDPNQAVNVTIRALEPTDRAIPDLWNVPFQQFLNNDANLNQRVSTLETAQGGTTLSVHRTAPTLDHPDGSVTSEKIANEAITTVKLANGAVTPAKLASGAAIANIGYTPVNKAGDTMTGQLTVPSLALSAGHANISFGDKRTINVYVDHRGDWSRRYYYLGVIGKNYGILKVQGIMGGHTPTEGRANVDLQFSAREGFRVDGRVIGRVEKGDIYVYDHGGELVYVYLVTDLWAVVNLELSAAGGAFIEYDGTYTTTEPTFGGNAIPPIFRLSTGTSNILRIDNDGNISISGDLLVAGTITGTLAPGVTPYDLAIFYPGTPFAGALLAAITVPRNLSLQGGSVRVGGAPAAGWTATIYHEGTAIGTVFVPAGQTTGTVSLNNTPTSLSAGALLRIVAPSTADSAIQDISISLQGVV
jgi:hypothetical protein